MYGWVWRHLPGPWGAKLTLFLMLVLAIVAVLFLWVFPWIEDTFGINRVTVG